MPATVIVSVAGRLTGSQAYPKSVLGFTASALLLRWSLPGNASLHGVALDRALLLNLTIFTGLFAVAHLILLGGLLLRKAKGGPQPLAHRRWHIELLPFAAISVLFATLAIHSERLWAAERYSGADPAAMQVEAAGMQFVWVFRYPGPDAAFGQTKAELIQPGEGNPVGIDPADEKGRDDFTTSELVLPAGREVDVRLRAIDVIHGFAIPELRVKQNAVPGTVFHVHFTPTKPGTYSILCTQVCGSGHYRMQAVARVLPPEQFQRWLSQQQQARQRAGTATP